MLRLTAVLALVLAITLTACEGTPTVKFTSPPSTGEAASWSFDAESVSSAPKGAEVFSGSWAVRAESDAPSKPNALCQTADAEFPAIALNPTVYGDVTVTTRFKAISGKTDQAAGIIARVQDKDNYYILRANALEGNVNLYKYAGGRRSGIKDGSMKVASGEWQELRLEVSGESLRGFLNGQLVVEATDATYKAGRVGLWTKADSVTCFDDVVVTPRVAGSAASAATAVARTGIPSTTPARSGRVSMGDNFFAPDELVVAAGATVTWEIVSGDAQHDVVSVDKFFQSNSPMGRGGDTFSYTFTSPGEYKYVCSYHINEGMTGKIVVK